MDDQKELKVSNIAYWIFIIGCLGIGLFYLQNFLKPLVIAFIFWYLIKKLRDLVSKVTTFGRPLPYWLITAVSTTAVFLIIYSITKIIGDNVQKLASDFHIYSGNIASALEGLETITGQTDLNEGFSSLMQANRSYILGFAGSFASLVGKFVLILLYVVFILLEERLFGLKILKLLNMRKDGQKIKTVGESITRLIDKYVSVKFLTSFLTGLLSYFALVIINVDLAALWAFIIFLLNFIPSIGSIVATLFPSLFAMVQFGSTTTGITVLIVVGIIQLFVGNILEPRIMGERLNMSPLVVILGLTFWGFVWGIPGMILSVPITSVMIIVFAQFENTKPIAIILTKNGELTIDQSK